MINVNANMCSMVPLTPKRNPFWIDESTMSFDKQNFCNLRDNISWNKSPMDEDRTIDLTFQGRMAYCAYVGG